MREIQIKNQWIYDSGVLYVEEAEDGQIAVGMCQDDLVYLTPAEAVELANALKATAREIVKRPRGVLIGGPR